MSPWPAANAVRAPALADVGRDHREDFRRRRRAAASGEFGSRRFASGIAKASEILAAHGGPRLKVVAFGTWDSDDRTTTSSQSLREFEQEVSPAPAQVAIGFSSQYVVARGRFHMGGTRGPLHSHILIKERARNMLETERLELLVHELGHFAGRLAQPRAESVMRPVLGQGLQRARARRCGSIPPNTLLGVAGGGGDSRRGRPEAGGRFARDAAADARDLRGARADDAGRSRDRPLLATGESRRGDAAAGGHAASADRDRARGAGSRRQRLAEAPALGADRGDRLLEFYVRQAALAAKRVRRENGPRAFVLAIGFALDDQGLLRELPIAGTVAAAVGSRSGAAASALAALGKPTMRGRNDLAKHFFVSVHLAALAGSEAARTAGLVKEMRDAQGGSGFSFRDMAANRAGVVFADAVLNGRVSLDDVAANFTVDGVPAAVDDLREDMDAEAFAKRSAG